MDVRPNATKKGVGKMLVARKRWRWKMARRWRREFAAAAGCCPGLWRVAADSAGCF